MQQMSTSKMNLITTRKKNENRKNKLTVLMTDNMASSVLKVGLTK